MIADDSLSLNAVHEFCVAGRGKDLIAAGIKTVGDLRRAIREGTLKGLTGLHPDTVERIERNFLKQYGAADATPPPADDGDQAFIDAAALAIFASAMNTDGANGKGAEAARLAYELAGCLNDARREFIARRKGGRA